MPFQIKVGSLVIVATNPAEALRLFDSLKSYAEGDDPVLIRDMHGIDIDPQRLRPTAEPDE
jgi:hypothetical protein